MAAKSTLKNMALCLTTVSLVCSAILAGAYAITAAPIEQAQAAKTNESIAKVLPPFTGNAVADTISFEGVEYPYYRAEGAGYAIISSATGFSGPVVLMVGIDEQGLIHNTTVLSQSETPGLGAKCETDEHFINQFKGWNAAETPLVVGETVDAITASTITSRAYARAVSNAFEVYRKIISEEGEANNE